MDSVLKLWCGTSRGVVGVFDHGGECLEDGDVQAHLLGGHIVEGHLPVQWTAVGADFGHGGKDIAHGDEPDGEIDFV
jgi:hypothetical protein